MPVDMELSEYLDGKFGEADRKRSEGLSIVHKKIDEHSAEFRASDAIKDKRAHDLSSQIRALEVKVDGHLESHASGKASSAGWLKLFAAGVIGGGSTWLAKHFGGT